MAVPGHQLGAALVTVTLDPPGAQALAVLLDRRSGVPHQAQHADDGWGEGPADTAAAELADALRAHGAGTYARVLTSGARNASGRWRRPARWHPPAPTSPPPTSPA
ncbi:hypothetical protein GCM10020367_70950 [Streptomyces sannanensis]|uniref:Uncharacterized protein n=1 Tax=Streptomyces sannanensis TaxID=285536 RepID=A0ABP6SNQ8_9ACTN